jgi:transcriptional regulator of heat shock response
LASFPEFSEKGNLEEILRELEDEEALIKRFRQDYATGMRVHIATSGKGLDETSFVVCPFRLKRNLEGTLCIIGPQRMDYGKAMAGLEYLAKKINAVHEFEPHIPLIEETKDR